MRRTAPLSPAQLELQASRRLESDVGRALSGKGPVVVGPWRGEVGYEVLYWIPFLRFVRARFGLDPADVVAVSRGGAAPWYAGIGDRYVDAFELVSTEDFRRGLAAEWKRAGGQKQGDLTPFDAELLTGVRERVGTFRLLHPSLMFRLFERVWKGGASLGHVLRHTEYARWQLPDDEVTASLPDRFVAARFYFRESFPDLPENRALVERALAALASERPVVLLDTGLQVDEHRDLQADGERLLRPLLQVDPKRNLQAQSAVVARAEAFVGTYGGFSYLAPAYGVRSIALASDAAGLFPVHLDIGRRAAAAAGASLTLLNASSRGDSFREAPVRPGDEVAAAIVAKLGTLEPAGLAARVLRRFHRPRLRARPEARKAPPVKTPTERRAAAALKELARGLGPVVAGPWFEGPELELLVWIPFLREAIGRGAVAPEDLFAIVRPGTEAWYAGVATTTVVGASVGRTFPADLVLELVEEVREDRAPLRSLTARLRYDRPAFSTAGGPTASLPPTAAADDPAATTDKLRGASNYVGAWGPTAALALTLGVPTTATVTPRQAACLEADLAYRAARSLRVPFALVASDAAAEARAFIDAAG